MKTIETTLGPIAINNLGRVNCHEHIIIDGGLTIIKEPDFRLDSVEKAAEELTRWTEGGGGVVVDTMPPGCGRNVDKLIKVSEITRIPIVVPTGFHKTMYYVPDHWQHRYDEETIAHLLQAEITEGADRNNYDGPIVNRSRVKAGIIKIATDYQNIAPVTRKLIKAIGQAHQATNVPVLVHTELGTIAHETLDLLEAAGVPPARVLLSHIDRNPDFQVHRQFAERGAFLQYDTPGRIKYQPENIIIDLMRRLFDAGVGQKLTLGGDTARRSYWKSYGGGPGVDYILTTFSQRLLNEGFSESELDQIWRYNPVSWLSGEVQAS